MNFTESYQFILSLINLPRKEYMASAKECAFAMKRMDALLELVGRPEKKIPHYIHVTGTSGKGSTVTYMHSILHAAGKKVGSSYSPHAIDITERWKYGGKQMTKKEFADIVTQITPMLDTYLRTSTYDMPSFFEITEIIGLLWFAQKKTQWVVLEVGCGGRYDASNCIPKKDIAIITNIGRDHLGIIGNTVQEIAYEKAGIITKGCTVYTAETKKSLLQIIQTEANKKQAPIIFHQPTYRVTKETLHASTFVYKKNTYTLRSLGTHQIHNATLCIDVATKLGIPQQTIQKGIAGANQPLRMEVVQQSPIIICDGAHNEDKIRSTVNTIKKIQSNQKKKSSIHLIVGFSENKDITTMIKILSELSPSSVACTRNTINISRTVAAPHALALLIKKHMPHTKTELFLSPKDALVFAKKQQRKNDILLVTGSIFLSGEVKHSIQTNKK
ncbi:MAG: hypothetical protein KBD15_02285 [Candidatus Magasanikbacteria bacterium]|nr:hypothetical protein [Candidatus Magasanikbacteria bacterium]